MTTIEGDLTAPTEARFALVAARFNSLVVDSLIDGARQELLRHGVSAAQLTVVRVPGAWELPLICQRLCTCKRFDAVIALGAVIRGGTPHFDFVAGAATTGLAKAGEQSGVPLALGLLTTDTMDQAMDRAGGKMGNKGAEAAGAAMEMVNLGRQLADAGL